eukprot:7243776-Ditylum_brightwellii.AAC.1
MCIRDSLWSEDTEEAPRGIGSHEVLHHHWPPFDSFKYCVCNGDLVFRRTVGRPEGSQVPDKSCGPEDHSR